jgi:hypothetical protein
MRRTRTATATTPATISQPREVCGRQVKLPQVRCCPQRIGALATAILTLELGRES